MRYSSLSLKDAVCLCATDPRDHEAWEEFVSRVGKHISVSIKCTAFLLGEPSTSPLEEDLAQETYGKLSKDRCRLLRDFAIQHADDEKAILRYIKKTAANATHDHFKRERSKKRGGNIPHVSTSDVDPEAGKQDDGSQERIASAVLSKEIDELLKHCFTGPDQERDRTTFWLYFRQGMSTREIACLPTIGLTPKGVGAVIERLKHIIRQQLVGSRSDSDDDEE